VEKICRAGHRPQTTIWRMRIACWIPKATNTQSEYAILTPFARRRLNATLYVHRLPCTEIHKVVLTVIVTAAFKLYLLTPDLEHGVPSIESQP
jgi:hypothetical protein